MKRGISFEITNEYGNFLEMILNPIDVTAYNWYIGGEESYLIENNQSEPLFPEEINGLDGTILKQIIEKPKYYLIFVNIKAFTKEKSIVDVSTFNEFLKSDCQIVLLIIDSVYVSIYCKDKEKLEDLNLNAIKNGYGKIQFITDENDFRTRLSVW